jgi:hypothetical protein
VGDIIQGSRAALSRYTRAASSESATGNLPSPLTEIARQRDFAVGTLGLWGPDHFVIYYRSGRVPNPGIAILGNVIGDVSIFDRPGSITIRVDTVHP